jgi:hypothetical protein
VRPIRDTSRTGAILDNRSQAAYTDLAMREGAGRFAIGAGVATVCALLVTTGVRAAAPGTIVQGALGSTSGISGGLDAISCTGATCWAVGASPSSPTAPTPALIEVNSGNGWSVVSSPSPEQSTPEVADDLSGIACIDAGDCWAVGSSGHQTLIENYAEGAWTNVSSPNPPGESDPSLTGVACPALDDCWAVGWARAADGSERTLIEHYDGTSWTIVASPNVSDPYSNLLLGVACPEAGDCWAVGGDSSTTPIIEHYNGSAWQIDPDVTNSGPSSSLLGVTCDSGGTCWAVGNVATTSDYEVQTLIDRYDGTAWERVSSPNPNEFPGPYAEDYLTGVTCDIGSECWAVGHSDYLAGAGYGQSVIERYTASTGWVVDGPDPALPAEQFAAVACGALECAAVGTDVRDIQPVIAESPVTMASVGGTHGGSAPPPDTSGSNGDAAPNVPDTGVVGMPWGPLLVGAGIASIIWARHRRASRVARRR